MGQTVYIVLFSLQFFLSLGIILKYFAYASVINKKLIKKKPEINFKSKQNITFESFAFQ